MAGYYPHLPDTPPADTPQLSVLLPCYNEHEVIDETHRRVKAVCEAQGCSYEILMVNDGSKDATFDDMLRLAASDPNLVLVNLSRNHGHQLALSAGLHVCLGQRVLIMDADLQDPPELLPDLMKLMDTGVEVVYAQRHSRPGDATLKRWACTVFYRLLGHLSETNIPLDTGDFRLISRRVLDVLLAMPERHRFLRGMISWVGFRQEPLLYDRDKRFAGETKYPFHKLLQLAIDGIVSSSIRPLAAASFFGAIAATLGLLLTAYALYSWLLVGQTPQGWTSLIITVTFLGSAQLFVLGIIGEYLGRLYEQSRNRPLFIIDRVVRGSDGTEGRTQAPDKAVPARRDDSAKRVRTP